MNAQPAGDAAAADGCDLVKASVLRGYIDALSEMQLLAQVTRDLPRRTAELFASPPPNTVWLPGMVVEDIANVIAAQRGLATVRQCGRRSCEYGTGRIARTLIEGVLRLFNASPAALLSRYQAMSRSFCKGVDFAYVATGAAECTMDVMIPGRKVSLASFCATGGGFEYVFDLCRKTGHVSDPEILRDGVARFRMRWSE